MIARQRRLVVGIALLLGALSGCASGQVTQTANQESAVNGASGQAGPIAVRDAMFVYPSEDDYHPSGSSVALTLTIVNTAGADDRLVMVESPAANSVRLAGQTTVPGRKTVRAIATVVEPAPTTTSPTTTATTTATTESQLADGELTIVLARLKEDIRPGRTVRVVLLFEQAGELELLVPIASSEEPRGESAH